MLSSNSQPFSYESSALTARPRLLALNFSTILYTRSSQPFGTCVPPNQNCTPLRTPKSDLYPLRVPPNKKLYPNKLHLGGLFLCCVPLWAPHVPLGVCVPQGCFTLMKKIQTINNKNNMFLELNQIDLALINLSLPFLLKRLGSISLLY